MNQASSRTKRSLYHLVAIGLLNIFLFLSPAAQAATVDLYDYAINDNGAIQAGAAPYDIPTGLDASGLGSLTYTITGAGNHSFIGFFDFEIDEATNTFYNEYGATGGVLAAGQSWEIDESGWSFGNLYSNVLAGSLDNTNSVPNGLNDDVSFALGWDFTLAAGDIATITLNLSDVLDPNAGFYLQHSDAQTGANFDELASIFMWSTLTIESTAVPEAGSLALLGLGLGLVAVTRRRRHGVCHRKAI